jgi:SPX domain protein involved in polyphosphate accumulation
LNVTGFRKALKKFEKTTKVHCLEMFTEERISQEAFAKGETIEAMLKSVEELFTEHFEHGDTKKARDRLRKQDYVATVSSQSAEGWKAADVA